MKTIVIILLAAAAVIGGYLLLSDNSADVVATPSPSPVPSASPSATSSVKTFNVTGRNFAFTSTEIRVKVGDRVKINFQSTGGNHDWVVDEFNARTAILDPGQSGTVEFVADKKGSFEYYCSVGTHRQMGMKGTLIVE